jgi:hypothetical protein
MTAESLWDLFLKTGWPECYTLFAHLRAEEAKIVDQESKTA